MRYFVRFGYDGSLYHGWQRQPEDISVQEVMEDALSVLMRRETEVVGAGRTDTGVHARMMYAHFDGEIPCDKDRFIRSLNRLVGKSVCIYDILEVTDNAHARFDAVSRTYRYFISSGKNIFMNGRCWECPYDLDMDLMNRGASLLLGTRDFTSFAKLHSDARTNICDVREAFWQPFDPFGSVNPRGLVFTITADRFLRNMVRAVVGTLVDLGRGRISLDGFSSVINARNRCAAGSSVAPEGLFLWDVVYPDNIFI